MGNNTATAQFAAEYQHRLTAPIIEWHHVVRLPNGEHNRVNRFDYNLAHAAGDFDGLIQLADTAWILVRSLSRLPEAA